MESMLIGNAFHYLPCCVDRHALGHRCSCPVSRYQIICCICIARGHLQHQSAQICNRCKHTRSELELPGLCRRIGAASGREKHAWCSVSDISSRMSLWQREAKALVQRLLLRTDDGLHDFLMHTILFGRSGGARCHASCEPGYRMVEHACASVVCQLVRVGVMELGQSV